MPERSNQQQTERANDAGSFDTGYGKPPKETRFRKGVLGNPKGRPKGHPNVATVAEQVLFENIVVTENGTSKSISRFEAVLKQMAQKASDGDVAAMRLLLALAALVRSETANVQAEESLSNADSKIIKRVLERIERSQKGCENDTNK